MDRPDKRRLHVSNAVKTVITVSVEEGCVTNIVMTISDWCRFCKKEDARIVDLEDDRQQPDQRLHRRYTLRSPEQLLTYLWLLEARVDNVRFHVHFAQLLAFAERHMGADSLGWSSLRGRYLEAVHHLTVDAHLLPCDIQYDEPICCRIYTKVDNWVFQSFSKESQCNSCRYSGISGWVDDSLNRRDMARLNRSRRLGNHIQACTIELILDVDGAELCQGGQVCPACHLAPMVPEDIVKGRSSLHVLHIEDGRCICPFTCIEA